MRLPPQIPAVQRTTAPLTEASEERSSQSLLSFLGTGRGTGIQALPCLIALRSFLNAI